MTKTPVMFRVSRNDPKDIYALFPSIAGDVGRPDTCTCYQHIGQHSSAHYTGCIASSRPATKAERRGLFHELRRIGYAMKLVSRQTPLMRAEIRRQLAR